jgi:hypothetical protein
MRRRRSVWQSVLTIMQQQTRESMTWLLPATGSVVQGGLVLSLTSIAAYYKPLAKAQPGMGGDFNLASMEQERFTARRMMSGGF